MELLPKLTLPMPEFQPRPLEIMGASIPIGLAIPLASMLAMMSM
jgi:hypothetical protein